MKEVNTGKLTNWPSYDFVTVPSLVTWCMMPVVSTWGSRYCMLEAIYFCFCFTQRCKSSMGKNFMHIATGEAGPIKLTCKLAGASSVQMCVCMSMCESVCMIVSVYLFMRTATSLKRHRPRATSPWLHWHPVGAIWEPDGIPL